MKIKTEIRTIAPKDAEELLKLNKSNRPLSQKTVNSYAKQMKSGQWKFAGEPLQIGDGVLLNGQHRLSAIIKSGIPQDFVIVSGLSNDAFDVIDTGRNRTSGDVLHINGIKNSSTVSSIVKFILMYNRGNFRTMGKGLDKEMRPTNSDVLDFAQRHEDISEIAEFAIKSNRKFKPLSPAVIGGMYFQLEKLNSKIAEDFFDKLINGSNLSTGCPVRHYREKLIRDSMSKAKLPLVEKVSLMVTAWNNFRAGKTIKRLEFSRSEFPVAR